MSEKKNNLSPKGFLFSAAEAAIKKPGRKDLCLIYSDKEAVMSGAFTTNKIKAAPVRIDMKRIRDGMGQAIIANSGNANACTGKQGMQDAAEITGLVAKGMKLEKDLIYICSTGVIGNNLPMAKIRTAIPKLLESLGKATVRDAAAAIMTTDTFPKVVSRGINIGRKPVIITGICKGAGMICPKMATMLCFIMTDANIEKSALDKALKDAVAKSFNRTTIDGDMSTNDTVLVMANGRAGNDLIKHRSKAFYLFASALSDISYELGRMIVEDGEGATKLIEIEVKNALNEKDAERGAFAIANSMLVKTAIYGNDANWGRIMAALGCSGIMIKEEKTDISLNDLKVVSKGLGTGKDEKANELLICKEIRIVVDLHLGKSSAKVLTCDLTEEYVRVNAAYRT